MKLKKKRKKEFDHTNYKGHIAAVISRYNQGYDVKNVMNTSLAAHLMC